MNISKCSEEARKMYETGKGYRDDTLFGEGYHNPQEVMMHEIGELGNLGSIEFWVSQYLHLFSEQEKEMLEGIGDCVDAEEFAEKFSNENEFNNFCERLITKIIDDRNYCVWLCACPEDVKSSYVEPFANNGSEWATEYTGEYIEGFNIPSDAIILDDLGPEGCLWCWKQ